LKRVLFVMLSGFALMPSMAAAEVTELDPLVVTATRVATPVSEVGSSVTVISREQIESRQPEYVLDVLRGVPGLDVVRQGGLGQQTSVFLRGANSTHTLVLIDGIEINDPSNPGRSFDFANLPADNVERIEIVRGPGSTLYGSDAMGGVINIISRKGSGKPAVTLNAEGGSFQTHSEKLSIRGGTERLSYSVVGSYLSSDGISAADKKYGNDEKDGYDRKAFSARLGLAATEALDFDVFYHYLDSEADLDTFGGPNGDDPNNTFNSRSNYFRTEANLSLFDRFWEQTLGFSLTDYERSNSDDPDSDHPYDSTRTHYDSQLYKVDWQHNLAINPANMLTLGAEYQEEKAKSRDERTFLDYSSGQPTTSTNSFPKKSANITGYYLQDQFQLGENFVATAGLRLDDHSRFGSHETWRMTLSYLVPATGTRFRATYGTAFKAPTLAQLYENSAWVVGNPDLDPEKSRGWDVGIEQALWQERMTFGATWFENRFKKLINTLWNPETFKYEYENVDKARTKGLELTLSVRPRDDVSILAGYTYTDTENLETGEELLRRPRNKYNLAVHYRIPVGGEVQLDILHVGKRDDIDSEDWSQVKALEAYTVVNLAAAYDLSTRVRLTGRVENLFDEDYEEVSGFGTPGVAGYLGARLSF
jgi:vitamin B12 transporter